MMGSGKSQKEGQRKNSKTKTGQKGKGNGMRKLNSKSADSGAEENMGKKKGEKEKSIENKGEKSDMIKILKRNVHEKRRRKGNA